MLSIGLLKILVIGRVNEVVSSLNRCDTELKLNVGRVEVELSHASKSPMQHLPMATKCYPGFFLASAPPKLT